MLSLTPDFAKLQAKGPFHPLHRSHTMGDRGTGHAQAIYGSQSFTRLEPSGRNRSSSVQKGLVVKNVNNGTEAFSTNETTFAQKEDIYETKASPDALVTSTKDLSTSTASSQANDEIPIEILSLIDRLDLEIFPFNA